MQTDDGNCLKNSHAYRYRKAGQSLYSIQRRAPAAKKAPAVYNFCLPSYSYVINSKSPVRLQKHIVRRFPIIASPCDKATINTLCSSNLLAIVSVFLNCKSKRSAKLNQMFILDKIPQRWVCWFPFNSSKRISFQNTGQ